MKENAKTTRLQGAGTSVTSPGQIVTTASGADIYQYMMDLERDETRNKREAERQRKYQQGEEEILR